MLLVVIFRHNGGGTTVGEMLVAGEGAVVEPESLMRGKEITRWMEDSARLA